MKKFIYIVIFSSLFNNMYCQFYDLVITSKSDSIVCHIDSISDSFIYFKMMVRNNWVSTNIDRNEVTEYKFNMLNEKGIAIKTDTSLTLPAKATEKKNAIHCYAGTLVFWGFLSANYEKTIRYIPGKSKLKFTTGFIYRYDENLYGVPLNITALYGKANIYLELTAGIAPVYKEVWISDPTKTNGYTEYKISVYPIVEFGFRHELKSDFFYRIILGSAGLGIGAGVSF